MAELPTRLRGGVAGTVREGEGLFDLRVGGDVNVVLANGLGGGSLINAGVMEVPRPEVFTDRHWPQALRGGAALQPWYGRARKHLGATKDGADNTIGRHPLHVANPLKKHQLLRDLAAGGPGRETPANFRKAALTIAMEKKNTAAGVTLSPCRLCGDCATGCNYGAKESLDTNLLVQAFVRGAKIYCGATVLSVQEPQGDRRWWRVKTVHTDPRLRQREGRHQWITAGKVILAAGTLGSTEILLRSQHDSSTLRFSPRLGQRFSGNGDMLCFGYDYKAEANAFADESQPPDARKIGPTITGVIEAHVSVPDARPGITIEELAVPGALRRGSEELLATSATLFALGETDKSTHRDGHPAHDPYAVHRDKLAHSSIFAAMGDDGAGGLLSLAVDDRCGDRDGQIRVVWPEAKRLPLFDAQIAQIETLARQAGFSGAHGRSEGAVGRTVPNPLWRLLPASMDFVIGGERGPLLTVHPLGGCAMGDSAASGVVDSYGRVFNPPDLPSRDSIKPPGPPRYHEGLVVLDGSIVPVALATNPALTIAALALRAVTHLRDEVWKWKADPQAGADRKIEGPRPHTRDAAAEIQQQAAARTPTMAEFTERLSGWLPLRDARGETQQCWVEVTLTYDELDLKRLFEPDAQDRGRMSGARLKISDDAVRPRGVLRVFRYRDWGRFETADLSDSATAKRREAAARSYVLSGELVILRREASDWRRRTWEGLKAWAPNRGYRDVYQAAAEWIERKRGGYRSKGPGIKARAREALHLGSHAGEVRRFDYLLKIEREIPSNYADSFEDGQPPLSLDPRIVFHEKTLREQIVGAKRITYARPSNPWRQLQELTLETFPGLPRAADKRVLKLDLRYLATQVAPLFRLRSQPDHVDALMDVISLGGYFARMLLSIHLWSARKPDQPRARQIERLPGEVPGLPEPEIHELEVDCVDGQPVKIRLARYRLEAERREHFAQNLLPIVTLHGYSASGTTFAHPSVDPSLAQYFARDTGRDVWVVDMRSSCGMPTAALPWTFERVAMADVPAAIDYVCAQTGSAQVDVIAHCMGSVMFSMAMLWDLPERDADSRCNEILTARDERVVDRFRMQRAALAQRVRRVVFSQVGPVMVFSPSNTFRAYATSFFAQVLGPLPYRFRPEPDEGLASELLDRLLSTLPYPDDELLLEAPARPCRRVEFAATRHRMDALYGADFRLGNVNEEVLDHLDDFFGPLSLDTVLQGAHFTRELCITNRIGRNRFVSRDSLRERWRFPTLSIHGDRNGLSDIATLGRMQKVLASAGCVFQAHVVEQHGHQDSLIGVQAIATFRRIECFLNLREDAPELRAPVADRFKYTMLTPWLGPVLSLDSATGKVIVSLGATPGMGAPRYLFIAAISETQGRWDLQQPLRALPIPLAQGRDTDWFAEPLPAWALRRTPTGRPEVRHLVYWLIYPQSPDFMLPDWMLPKMDALQWGWKGGAITLDHGEAGPHMAEEQSAQHLAFAEALQGAINAMNPPPDVGQRPLRANAGRLPLGVVCLDHVRSDEVVSAPQTLCLALGSCQYPPGMLDRVPAYQSWERLNALYEAPSESGSPAPMQPEFMILAGDQIYADATAGLFDPTETEDRFRKPHETWLRSAPVRDAMRRLPMTTLIDDHEIDDGWEPVPIWPDDDKGKGNRRLLREGIDSFRRFQRPRLPRSPQPTTLWGSFERKGLPLFLLDTRTERSLRGADSAASAKMIGEAQFAQLKTWLLDKKQEGKPRVIVSPSLLLPRHRYAARAELACGEQDSGDHAALRSDAWDGYPADLYELLGFIAEHQIPRVVFLSGDEHMGLSTRITLTTLDSSKPEVTVHSIHAPGLYAPFGFANASESNFIAKETLKFSRVHASGATFDHECHIETTLVTGAGFVILSFQPRADGSWSVAGRFDTTPDQQGPAIQLDLE